MITSAMVYDKLKTVMDPELHINIVDLGLVYQVAISPLTNTQNQIIITMTLTTPGCPLAPEIERLVKEAMISLGNYETKLNLVWEPAWSKDMMSDEAKLTLGMI